MRCWYTFANVNTITNNKIKKNMNKQELVDAMAESTGSTKADAKKALDAFIEAVSGALKKGDRISLVGFGSYSVAERSAREGRNPQTGKEIQIKASKRVKFSAGKALKDSVK